ncbi:hypothetical protein PACILC2_06910 [Paenibacillus cisolokensis]|uniref:EF-hand domain-containing protein n=1 Tax=Paenibacillus cisolokensis TaxID=1658519 RepID=A0ABQ4N1S1_9BACL|nr:hypothetical protein [Paenibacillus cisolokensis]GIQ62123.1 hypothetical protein PACILC2_06910 [Paenibacillus cisolokensis]
MKQKLIEEGDPEANYAYYALHKLHILPGQFAGMSREERAFVIACIDVRLKAERKSMKKRSANNGPVKRFMRLTMAKYFTILTKSVRFARTLFDFNRKEGDTHRNGQIDLTEIAEKIFCTDVQRFANERRGCSKQQHVHRRIQ